MFQVKENVAQLRSVIGGNLKIFQREAYIVRSDLILGKQILSEGRALLETLPNLEKQEMLQLLNREESIATELAEAYKSTVSRDVTRRSYMYNVTREINILLRHRRTERK